MQKRPQSAPERSAMPKLERRIIGSRDETAARETNRGLATVSENKRTIPVEAAPAKAARKPAIPRLSARSRAAEGPKQPRVGADRPRYNNDPRAVFAFHVLRSIHTIASLSNTNGGFPRTAGSASASASGRRPSSVPHQRANSAAGNGAAFRLRFHHLSSLRQLPFLATLQHGRRGRSRTHGCHGEPRSCRAGRPRRRRGGRRGSSRGRG